MKPYLLFAYDHYEPAGGIDDYCGDFDTVAEACAEGYRQCDPTIHGFGASDHWDVVDRTTMRIVASDRQARIP